MSLSFWSLYYSKISFWGEILYRICLVLESTAAFSFIFSYMCACAKSLQLCSTLRDPMDCNLPGSSVCGVLQARILEWVAISYSQNIRLFIYKDMTIYIYIISSQIDFSLLRESLKIFRFDVSFSFYFISNQNQFQWK